MTSSGWRGPYRHRSACPPSGALIVEPHEAVPFSASRVVCEELRIGGMAWSYQPSESSYAMTTAVDFQSLDFCSALMVLTRKCCSSIGSE